MNDQKQGILFALNDIDLTTNKILESLESDNLDKAYEGISIMLMQGMNHFGPQSPAMQQFFPVWDSIKSYIESKDMDSAIGQTKVWQRQLHEIISMVEQS